MFKWKKKFLVARHENIFDISYFLSMQGHNNMDNDEYQVFFFKGWHAASSTHLPRSDFLILREQILFIEYGALGFSVNKSCHSEMNGHK